MRPVPEAVASGPSSGLVSRVLSALALAAIALMAIAAGPVAFTLVIALSAAVLAWEWTRVTGEGRFGRTGLTMSLTALGVVAVGFVGRPWMGLVAAVAAAVVVCSVASGTGRAHPLWLALGPLYIGIPCVALIWLQVSGGGGSLILWLLLTIWATDTGAYFAGRLIGGPRLAPAVSPNKTWAGLGGAVLSAGAIGVIIPALDAAAPAALYLAPAGAALAVVAQAGDLAESLVKRRFGLKDASRLIPGHGGLLDRLDGMLAAAPVLALWQWLSGGEVLRWT